MKRLSRKGLKAMLPLVTQTLCFRRFGKLTKTKFVFLIFHDDDLKYIQIITNNCYSNYSQCKFLLQLIDKSYFENGKSN